MIAGAVSILDALKTCRRLCIRQEYQASYEDFASGLELIFQQVEQSGSPHAHTQSPQRLLAVIREIWNVPFV